MIIYRITNNINGKKYVGKTTGSLQNRWKTHKHKGSILHLAIKKYGENNFTKEVIDTANTTQDLANKELFWIQQENSMVPNGYNIVLDSQVREYTPEMSIRIKEGLAKNIAANPEAFKERQRKATESAKSPEARLNNSNARKLLLNSNPELKEKMLIGLKNFKQNNPEKFKEAQDRAKKTRRTQEFRKGNSERTKALYVTDFRIKSAIAQGAKYFLVYKDNEFIAEFLTQQECARALNLHQSSIGKCLANKQPKHKGYTFKYKEIL